METHINSERGETLVRRVRGGVIVGPDTSRAHDIDAEFRLICRDLRRENRNDPDFDRPQREIDRERASMEVDSTGDLK